MIKNPITYKNKTYMSNDVSLIDRNEQFIVSGHPNMFTNNPKNIGYQSPLALHKHNPPINISELVDIYCGINVVFYVTKHNIYSSYISGVPINETIRVSLGGAGRKIVDFSKESFEKIVLPDNIIITPTSFVKKIVSGFAHSVILMDNNRMLIFGSNAYGQIGENNDIQKIIEPKLVDMSQFDGKVIDVICGYDSTFVLTDKGILYTAYVMHKKNVTEIAKENNIPEDPTSHGFTKVCFDKKIVKMVVTENMSIFLASNGTIYGICDVYYACKKIILVEQSQEDKIFIKDLWCTRLAMFVLAQNGDIYMAGSNIYNNMFTLNDGSTYNNLFAKCDYLSQKGITNIIGSDAVSIALNNIDKNIYISGYCDKKFFSNDECILSSGENFKSLSNIAQKYSGYDLNIQNSIYNCSFTFRATNGYTKDLCYMVCNLYKSVFGETNNFSDISFI